MSLREFRDRSGVEWRAWDITPERMHPVTAREMFLGRYVDFQEGWIVFESEHERRRLAPYPIQWADFAVDQLEALLQMAQPTPRRLGETSGAFRRLDQTPVADAENAAAQPPTASSATAATSGEPSPSHERRETTPTAPERIGEWREFVGPSGRRWTVSLATPSAHGASDGGAHARRLLRFAAEDGTVCDLEAWPDDWQRFTSAQLMELLRRAEPSRDALAGHTPRRRREDRQP
jgi:hypothetical protein